MKKTISSADDLRLDIVRGEKYPAELPMGTSTVLYNPNTIIINLKIEDIQDMEIGAFEMDLVQLGLQKYSKEVFNTKYDCYSFSLNIGDLFENGLAFCNFNISSEIFCLTDEIPESYGYGIDLYLVNEDNVVVGERKIGTATEFSQTLADVYKESDENFNKEEYFKSLDMVASGISHLYNKQIIEKYSIAKSSQV